MWLQRACPAASRVSRITALTPSRNTHLPSGATSQVRWAPSRRTNVQKPVAAARGGSRSEVNSNSARREQQQAPARPTDHEHRHAVGQGRAKNTDVRFAEAI